jgi:hypothetical protein
MTVDVIDTTSRKHVHAAGKRGIQCALQHENVNTRLLFVVGIAH